MRGIQTCDLGQAPRVYSFDRKVYDRAMRSSKRAIPLGIGGCFGGPSHVKTASNPTTIITSVAVTHWYRADLGITLNTGKVSAWNDQVGSAHLVQISSSKQPTYSASDATFGSKATITADGVDDLLAVASVNLTGNIFFASVVKLIAASNSAPFYSNQFGFTGDGNYLQTFSGAIYQSGPSTNANVDGAAVAAMTGNWARFYDRRQNNLGDYVKFGNRTKVSGTPCPLAAAAGQWGIAGASSGAIYLNCAYRELVICNGEPTSLELSALDAYFSSQGSLLV